MHVSRARRVLASSLVILALGLVAGCSTAISTMQPAETLPKGHWHVGMGMDVSLPVTRVAEAVDAVSDIADKYRRDPGYTPTEEEQRRYLGAAIGLALNHPSVLNDIMVRYGAWDGVSVGFRYAGNSIHFDGKVRLFEHGVWQGALSIGYVRALFGGPIFDVLAFLQIDDFSRHDVHVPLIVGRRLGNLGHVWFGPKYIFGRTHIDAALQNVDTSLRGDENVHYIGGFGGAAVGYSRIFLMAELTVMDMIAKPVILGQPTDIGGIVVMPSVGVMARF
jgi:hypothetical protein